jgi:MFS family permease
MELSRRGCNHPRLMFVPLPIRLLELTGFTYGLMLSCSAIWGPWLSELYPPHLRSTAASIFNWGRVISMTAPMITAPLAPRMAKLFSCHLPDIFIDRWEIEGK